MWVFGYGSLIWDDWEGRYGCLARYPAELQHHARSFNKSSIKRWGSKKSPGPTLNLVRHKTKNCGGIAFEFPEEKRQAVLAYLSVREGESFNPVRRRIHLRNGKRVWALTPVYSGKNLIKDRSLKRRVQMALAAKGEEGSCYDYIKEIVDSLKKEGIDDAEVAKFWLAVQRETRAGA